MITVAGMQAQMADLEKRRKNREPLTAAHAADEAAVAADCAGAGHCEDAPAAGEDARKSIAGLEAEPGPGTFRDPVTPPGPEAYARPYLDAGHAAPSPVHAAPNVAPLPPAQPGVLMPLQMTAAPVVSGHPGPAMQAMAARQARG